MTDTTTITPRLSIPLSEIDVTGILRRDPGDVSDIIDSIKDNLAKGLPALIHPVVIDYKKRLISGSRRLAAHRALGLTEIDYQIFEVLDDGERVRLEIAANYQEKFKWQERVLGIEKYHRFFQTNAHLQGNDWGVRETGKVLNLARNPVHRAIVISEYLHANDEEIWKAETMQDAFRILIKREEEAQARLLVVQSLPTGSGSGATRPSTKPPAAPVSDDDFFASLDSKQGGFTPAINSPVTTDERPGSQNHPGQGPVIPLSTMLLKSSGPTDLSPLESLGPDCCDHIITDPPYGVPNHIETIYQGTRFAEATDVAEEHIAEETAQMMTHFYPAAFRAIRPRGFLIMWCDPIFWWQHCLNCQAAGFNVQRWPLVWLKTSPCINQYANTNWTKNIEFAVVARKTNATLLMPQKSCVWTGGNDMETRLIGHPFAKPFGLWEWLYRAVCPRGAEVIDPFAGKGSSVLPAIDNGLRFRAIECSQIHYDGLVTNVMSKYKALDPTCSFS